MKIVRIDVFRLDIPLSHIYSLSGGRLVCSALESTLVLLETDAGINGVGESCPWGSSYLPAFAKGVRAGIEELAGCLLGKNPLEIKRLDRDMDAALPGHLYVKSAIDMACWDILGKHCKLPVYMLLGGKFQESIPMQSSIPTGSPEEMMEGVSDARQEGYRSHSCKIGVGVDEDLACIEALLHLRVPGEAITFDVNRAWRVADASAVMNSVSDRSAFFEQPCATLDECAAVRALTTQSIILDECIEKMEDIRRAHQGNVAQAIGLKTGRVGGLTKARLIRDYCVDAGIKLNIEDTGGTLVADTAAAHLAFSTPPEYERATWNCCRHHAKSVGTGGLQVESGRGYLTSAPGLGIVIDRKALGSPVASYE